MKGRIEHRDLGHPGEKCFQRLDPLEIVRIMERGDGYAFFDGGQDIIIDGHGTGEALASVHNPMTHGRDAMHIAYGALLFVG